MRVAVVGAGAMGGLYGAMFRDAGQDVVFIERDPATVDAITRDGLVITRRDGREDVYRIAATAEVGSVGRTLDLILFQVKGFATPAAAETAQAVVGPDTIVLSLQNGLGNEDVLRAAFPANPLLLGISVHSAARLAPGRILHSGTRATYIGPADEAWAGEAQRAAEALAGSGYEVVRTSSEGIRREIHAKWVLNCGSLPTAALTGLVTDELGRHELVLRLSDALTREACELARLEGFDFDADERAAYNRELYRTAGGKASMLQDVEDGRRTEIDSINGAAVRIADRHGHPAPLNRALYALVKGRETAMDRGMTTTLRFLGASGFEVVGPRFRLLMEPFLRHNPMAPYTPEDIPAPDLILVSHAAWDHMGDAAEIARRTGAPIVCPGDVAEKMIDDGVPSSQVRATIWGVCYAFGDIVVRPVECHHWSSATLRDGRQLAGVPLSFIVETEPGVRIYHFGDTCLFPGLRLIGELYRPTVGLLGVAQTDGLPDPGAGALLTGEMNPDEAALAAEWLGLRHAVATHYMNPGPEVEEFARRVPAHDTTGRRVVHAPKAGDVITIEPEPSDLPSLAWGRTSPDFDLGYRPPMAEGPVPG